QAPRPAPAMPPAPSLSPTVRGVAPEGPAAAPVRAPVAIPSPEQLGVAPATYATAPAPRPGVAVDWTAVRARLQQLGAVSFFLERQSAGGYRFSCWLPCSAAPPERIDGVGGTEGEAVGLCLERAGTASRLARASASLP